MIVSCRKAGEDPQEFWRVIGEIRSRSQGARQTLIGLLVPAVQKVRDVAGR